MFNVETKLPRTLHAEVRRRIRDISSAESRAECENRCVADLSAASRNDEADTVLREWEDFISMYSYPKEHLVDQPVGVGLQRCQTQDRCG